MKPVLADTSYFVALLGKSDSHHKQAVEWSEQFLGQTFVTVYVLVELGSSLSSRGDRDLYVPFVTALLDEKATLFISASATLFRQGLSLFESRPDKEWSLVDCISFIVMQKHRLHDALTTDRHFEQAGFRALLRARP